MLYFLKNGKLKNKYHKLNLNTLDSKEMEKLQIFYKHF